MKLKKIICTALSLTLIGTLFVPTLSASAAGNNQSRSFKNAQ